MNKNKGITLVALIVTIIILLILAGITISSLTENGLFAKAKEASETSIRAEMKEKLILSIQSLYLEKVGNSTIDDITQEWADKEISEYEGKIIEDASISGKKIRMKKNGISATFIIDEKLNITEISSTGFTYEVKSKEGDNLEILITVINDETGLNKITLPNGNVVECNGAKEKEIPYTVEFGKEYKVIIETTDGKQKEEKILINEYYYEVTKNLPEGIKIDNTAAKTLYNNPYQATITTEGNYILETLTVTMGGQPVTVDLATGVIEIANVTGDIEITAIVKKIEIQYTAIAVSTSSSANNTSSLGEYTQTLGTTLYINIIAKLEGINCTVTLKEDSSKIVPYAITRNGKYIFTVTGTYNGKTITEEKEVTVNQYEVIGAFVQYDAGEWTEDEIKALQNMSLYNINISKTANKTSELNFTFGGFTYKGDQTNESSINDGTIIVSRNQSVTPEINRGTPKYEGWQILESEEKDGKTYITKLIHAGSPENFVYCNSTDNDGYRAEYILSSGMRQKSYNTYQARSWDMYRDKELDKKDYIKNVHATTYEEAIDMPGGNSGIRNTGAFYWLASTGDHYALWMAYSNGSVKYNMSGYFYCFGVRPVVELNNGVYIVSGDGTEESPYVLGKD